MTVQLATRIDPKAKKTLDKLHNTTHIPIRQLTEKAILLLDEYYNQLKESYKQGTVDNNFIHLVDKSIQTHNKTYKKLAE